ncbi:hypothetical protein LX32DRAFT_214348 [Colletotrichum zoysiae]|uniref:Uncharacterized protein n=1 Tax=Colletotrichum zoysiae TaxID=1216348 RepID=A0AAD9H433_9PEZI|nr:hypothetical protein LX32DRAFT_214348 [Colletotrichum zoysiae]
MAESHHECTVCLANFETRELLCEHAWAFQSDIATSMTRLQALLAHQCLGDTPTPDSLNKGDFECTVCWKTFVTREEVRGHVWLFQTQFTALFAELQVLMVHQRLGDKKSATQDIANDSEDDDESDMGQHLSIKMPSTCPHEDCAQSNTAFKRMQELIRHFGTLDYICNEFCRFCSCTYTRASKFWTHKCATSGPPRQRQHVKNRNMELRRMTRKELTVTAKRKRQASPIPQPDFDGIKKIKVAMAVGVPAVDLPQIQSTPVCNPTDQPTAFPNSAFMQSTSTASLPGPTGFDQTIASLYFDVAPQAYQQLNDAPIWFDSMSTPSQPPQGVAMSTPLWPMNSVSSKDQATLLCADGMAMTEFAESTGLGHVDIFK